MGFCHLSRHLSCIIHVLTHHAHVFINSIHVMWVHFPLQPPPLRAHHHQILAAMVQLTAVMALLTTPFQCHAGSAVSFITAGAYHTCVIMESTDGVRCWGYNGQGQLGIGSYVDADSPPTYDVITGVDQVAAGDGFTCVRVMSSSSVRCWGSNTAGQLGNSGGELTSPPSSDTVSGVSQVTAGSNHVCILRSASSGVVCWGSNSHGQLGRSVSIAMISSVPSDDVVTGVSQVAAGGSFTCVIMTSTQVVRCWGANAYGQLGNGGNEDVAGSPTINSAALVSAIALGGFHTCVLNSTTSGISCWGRNNVGQAGNGMAGTDVVTPSQHDVMDNVVQVIAGGFHTCGVNASSGIHCWGDNTYGQLGSDGAGFVSAPPSMTALYGVAKAAAGLSHTCTIMTSTAGVRCWGRNNHGQLGVGNLMNVRLPPAADITFAATSSSAALSIGIGVGVGVAVVALVLFLHYWRTPRKLPWRYWRCDPSIAQKRVVNVETDVDHPSYQSAQQLVAGVSAITSPSVIAVEPQGARDEVVFLEKPQPEPCEVTVNMDQSGSGTGTALSSGVSGVNGTSFRVRVMVFFVLKHLKQRFACTKSRCCCWYCCVVAVVGCRVVKALPGWHPL